MDKAEKLPIESKANGVTEESGSDDFSGFGAEHGVESTNCSKELEINLTSAAIGNGTEQEIIDDLANNGNDETPAESANEQNNIIQETSIIPNDSSDKTIEVLDENNKLIESNNCSNENGTRSECSEIGGMEDLCLRLDETSDDEDKSYKNKKANAIRIKNRRNLSPKQRFKGILNCINYNNIRKKTSSPKETIPVPSNNPKSQKAAPLIHTDNVSIPNIPQINVGMQTSASFSQALIKVQKDLQSQRIKFLHLRNKREKQIIKAKQSAEEIVLKNVKLRCELMKLKQKYARLKNNHILMGVFNKKRKIV